MPTSAAQDFGAGGPEESSKSGAGCPRSGGSAVPSFCISSIRLVVDVKGHVRSAEVRNGSMQDGRALAAARALEYRPFLQDGMATEVEYDEYVRVLPAEKLPTVQVPFPRVDDLRSVQFFLRRGACFGPCPVYDLQISGEGEVAYLGKNSVAVEGEQRDRVSRQAVQGLLQSFEKGRFFLAGRPLCVDRHGYAHLCHRHQDRVGDQDGYGLCGR